METGENQTITEREQELFLAWAALYSAMAAEGGAAA